jgi:hypothetical protein
MMSSVLSRRINGTVDWSPLGGPDGRFQFANNGGESVLFKDSLDAGRILKLRGRPENGFDSTGFGCILGRNRRGFIEVQPGTLAQALVRESLCWEQFGFGSTVAEIIGDDAGLLLSQPWITPSPSVPVSKTRAMIDRWMRERGWEPLQERRDVVTTLRGEAWCRDGLGAFDVHEHNFILSEDDDELYPVDVIVWPLPD